MKVLVAGATGALGKQLVPRLAAAGHEVTGMTRSESKRDALRALGAVPVVADALEPEAVARAVAEAEPEAIVHQLTALSGSLDMRHFERDFALTNRLRTEGTDHLLAAGRAVGVERFVAQSFAGWPYARSGGSGQDRGRPARPRAGRRPCADARGDPPPRGGGDRRRVDRGIVLRYGGFYGPGTSLGADGEHLEAIRRRRFPVVGDGAGVWSFVHIEDAAEATVAAVEHGSARASTTSSTTSPPRWPSGCRSVASSLGARPPRRVPRWLGRLLAGEAAAVMMTEMRGASNAKAKRELGWQPRHPSWRAGFAEGRREPDRGAARRAAAGGLRDRLPDAGQRGRGRGRRPGGAAAAAPRARGRRADRLAARVRWRRSPRAWRSTSCARRACARENYVGEWLPEPLVTGAERRPGAPRRDGRLAVAGVPGAAREPVARAARRPAAARRLRLRLRRDRRASSARARRTSASSPRARGATSRSGGRASRPRASSATSWPSASSPPPREGDLAALEALLAEDVVLHGDGGGKVAGAGALAARPQRAWRARWRLGAPGGRAVRAAAMRQVEVNGQPGGAGPRRRRRGSSA